MTAQAKPMGEYALDYARRGWAVFPCKPSNKAPYVPADVDGEGNKIPNTGGLYKATADPDLIRDWWQRWPHAMIGVRMGEASGVWALDPDAPKEEGEADGRANWAKLVAKHGGCPPTHTHKTPGGGAHLLFKWRPDRPVTNSEGQLKGLGINVRGNGGYVIAPPSQRHDGKAYELLEPLDFFNFAAAPEWLYEMLRPKPQPKPQPKPKPQNSTWRSETAFRSLPIARIQGVLNRVATTTEGDRNKLLFWGAMRVVDMVVNRAIPPSEGDRAFAALADAAHHAGLSQREIVQTLQSARARA